MTTNNKNGPRKPGSLDYRDEHVAAALRPQVAQTVQALVEVNEPLGWAVELVIKGLQPRNCMDLQLTNLHVLLRLVQAIGVSLKAVSGEPCLVDQVSTGVKTIEDVLSDWINLAAQRKLQGRMQKAQLGFGAVEGESEQVNPPPVPTVVTAQP